MKLSETRFLKPYKIWVLVPYLESDDPTIQHYYDFSQSLAEYSKVFEELKADWKWQTVTMSNYKQVIQAIADSTNGKQPLVLNLCDGDEVNGTPGISVIHELKKHGLIFTGSDAHFYEVTTSKIPMKKAFDKSGVSTANWRVIAGLNGSIRGICKRVGTPIIIKPAVSGGSMGVSVKNVVQNEEELSQRGSSRSTRDIMDGICLPTDCLLNNTLPAPNTPLLLQVPMTILKIALYMNP